MADPRRLSGYLLALTVACLAWAAESQPDNWPTKVSSAVDASNASPLLRTRENTGVASLRTLKQANGGSGTSQTCKFYSAAEDAVVLDKEQEKVDRALWTAADDGKLRRVKKALKDGACIDAVIEVISEEFNGTDTVIYPFGTTALEAAAGPPHTDVILFLLDEGADVNAGNATGIFNVVLSGVPELAEAFVAAGADLESKWDLDGSTPLVAVAQFPGSTLMVGVLIDLGADVDGTNNAGSTALFFAAQNSDVPVAQVLIDAGADVDKANTVRGATPLIIATQLGSVDIFRLLLEAGADPTKANKFGTTPLHLAAFRLGKAGLEMTGLLLDSASDVDIGVRDEDGRTPLMWASRFGNTGVASLLLERGADASAVDNDGRSAADLICDCVANAEEEIDEETGFPKLQCPPSGCNREATTDELRDIFQA